MNIAVRYQSRGGNTRAVAEVIANTLGVQAETIDNPIDEYVDILFLGGGAYKWDADPALKKYMENLNAQKIGKIAAFTTTGAMKVVLDRIAEYGGKSGITVSPNKLLIKMMLKGHSALKREGGHLSEEQIEKTKAFAKEVVSS